jgi:hypothetical protein
VFLNWKMIFFSASTLIDQFSKDRFSPFISNQCFQSRQRDFIYYLESISFQTNLSKTLNIKRRFSKWSRVLRFNGAKTLRTTTLIKMGLSGILNIMLYWVSRFLIVQIVVMLSVIMLGGVLLNVT